MEYIESFRLLGVQARQKPCLPGQGAPAVPAVSGELYMDIDTGDLYKCVGGTWRPMGSESLPDFEQEVF